MEAEPQQFRDSGLGERLLGVHMQGYPHPHAKWRKR